MVDAPVDGSKPAIRWGVVAAFAALALGVGAVVGGLAGSAVARDELEPAVASMTAAADSATADRDAAISLAADRLATADRLESELASTQQSLTETNAQLDGANAHLNEAIVERDAAIAEATRMGDLYDEAFENGAFVQSQRDELAGQLAGLNGRFVELGIEYEATVAEANAQDLKRFNEYNALVDQANSDMGSLQQLLATCQVDVLALYVRSSALGLAIESAALGDFDSFATYMSLADESLATYTDQCRAK